MPTNIGPTIGIEGEREFRNSIKQINASLQALKSEEEAVTSAFDKNDKSAEALAAQQEVLNKRIEEQKKLIAKLEEGLQKAAEKTGDNSTVTLKWQTTLNKANTELNKMEQQAKDNAEALEDMADSSTDAGSGAEDLAEGSEKSADALDALAQALMAEKILSGLKDLAGMLRECVDASVAFESAMAGVAKTTDLSDTELSDMADQIKQLSTEMPVAATELAGIVESAGQLGIAKDDLVSFATVMANLGVATNLSSEEAASALAKFANITGTSADDYERLGSTIVAMGNNFATTESDIVSMATRLASTGNVVGLTEAEIMALATAMSSVGIEAEAGGSAMAKLLKQFDTMVATGSTDLERFANIAGMTADEFSAAWKKNATGALSKFIDGLGELDKSGGSATATLEELGLTEVRLSNTVLSLAGSGGLLTEALDAANAAWDENTALTKEAETRYSTTESKMEMLSNAANNLKIAIGDALTPTLANLATAGTDILNQASAFVSEHPEIVQAISALGIALGVIAAGFAAATIAVKAFNAILTTLQAHPVMAIVTAVVSLTAALVAFSAATREASKAETLTKTIKSRRQELDELTESYEASTESLESEKAGTIALLTELKSLNSVQGKTAEQKARIQAIVEDLNEAVPELALAYDEESASVKGLTAGVDEYIDSLYRQYATEANANQIVELMRQRAEAAQTQAEAQAGYNAALAETERIQAEMDALAAAGYTEDTYSQMVQLQDALTGAQYTQNEWNAALTEANGIVADYDTQIEELKNGIVELSTETSTEAPAAITEVCAAIEELQTAYNDAYNAAYDSLTKQTGLFKSFDNEATTSVETLQANLDSQVQWMTDYANNLTALSNRGIAGVENLVAILSDGSTESAAALAGLATASDEEVQQIINSLGDVEETKGLLSGVIAEEVTDFDAKMDELAGVAEAGIDAIGDMTPEAKQAAINVVNGLISGINMQSPALRLKMVTLGRNMISWVNYGTDSHSPSKEAIKASGNVMAGLMVGIEEDEDALNSLMEDVGEQLVAHFGSEKNQEKAKEVLEQYKTYLQDFVSGTQDELGTIEGAWQAVADKQETLANKMAEYGDLIEERTIDWSDGSSTSFTVLSNLDQQIAAIEAYGEALDKLNERGLSSGLLEEVVSMDIDEATQYANMLLQLSDAKFDEYNQKWEEKQQKAKDIAAQFYKDELDAISEEYDSKLASSLDQLKDTAYTSGQQTVAGLIKGMESKEQALKQKAAEIAAIVESAMRQELDIHSPSKVTEELGEYTAEGFEIGLSKRMDEIDRMTQSALSIDRERDSAVVNAIGAVSSGANNAQPATITLTLPNGTEMARWLIDDLRSINNSSPEIKSDF